MKNTILILIVLSSLLAKAQVGINTTTPNAQLEIRSSNQVAPSAIDGLLIPKVDVFPSGVTLNQDAMLVYLTTTVGSNTPGFYYWNNATTTWLPIGSGAERINDLIDGKSDNDGSQNGSSIFLGIDAGANDNGTDNRNIGVGYQSLNANIFGAMNIAIGNSSLESNTSGGSNVAIGVSALSQNGSGSFNVAVGTAALGNSTIGRRNIAIGYSSLNETINRNDNIGIGYYTLDEANANNNIAIGTESQRYNTLGEDNVSIGLVSQRDNTNGRQNVSIGNNALTRNLSNRNVAIGHSVLYFNTLGRDNTAVGTFSAWTNTTGVENTAVGMGSLYGNSTGHWNTAIGYYSMYDAEGSNNTAIGRESLRYNQASGNTGVGVETLRNNDTGDSNSALGIQALRYNTEGSYNTAVGRLSLYQNRTGDYNTAMGHIALRDNFDGIENTALGSRSMIVNTSGNNNTALGSRAGISNLTGNNNVYLGFDSGYNNAAGSNNIFIGTSAGYFETTSNKLYIENSNADATNALIYGEFDTDFLRLNARTEITNTTDASGTVGSGALEIANSLRLDGNEIITNNNGILFLQADNNGDLRVDGITLNVDASSNRVGIGISTPSYPLDVVGDINTSGNIRQSGGSYSFPDYVFETYFDGFSTYNPDYKLVPLSGIEAHLRLHKHLPGIQNRAEVAKYGFNVTEGVRGNLEKIEELYLYVIELERSNKELKKQVKNYENLEKRLRHLESKFEKDN